MQAFSPTVSAITVRSAQFQLQRGLNQLLWHLEQVDGERHQFIRGQAAVALVHGLGQRVGDPGAHPDHRRLLDAELHGDRVGGLEADAADVARQPIRVLGHDLDGIGAVGLEDANGAGGADAMAVQEDHDLAHDLLLGPGAGDALGAHGADAGHLAQAVRLGLDNVEHFLAERLDHLLGVDRADAADHARAEILLDAFGRGRAEVRMKRALNCWPWVRSLIHSPEAVIHSPAEIVAACPTTVTRSRCPRALMRRTQKPFSALWKVTRSTRPASTSWSREFLLESHRRFKRDCSSNYRQRITLEEVGQGICKAKPLRFQYASEAR